MIPRKVLRFINDNGISRVIVRDPKYYKKDGWDVSRPGFALVYDCRKNVITFTKIDNSTLQSIVGDTKKTFKVDNVKDIDTFLKFVDQLDKSCKEYNCDYANVLSNKGILLNDKK